MPGKQEADWRVSVGATLELLKKFYEASWDASMNVYAMRHYLAQKDVNFEKEFAACYGAVVQEFDSAHHTTLHMLDKLAGQLKGDPFWKD